MQCQLLRQERRARQVLFVITEIPQGLFQLDADALGERIQPLQRVRWQRFSCEALCCNLAQTPGRDASEHSRASFAFQPRQRSNQEALESIAEPFETGRLVLA